MSGKRLRLHIRDGRGNVPLVAECIFYTSVAITVGLVGRLAGRSGAGLENADLDNVATWSYIRSMKAVGLRELKNRLSEYVRQVRSGESVLVTDRGEVVAELSPPGQATAEHAVPSGLVALARKGLLTLGTQNDSKLYPALPRLLRRQRVAQLLDEERGSR